MIKKALVSAGFAEVPVVTLSTSLEVLNDQPGFEFDVKEYMYKAILGMLFTDALSEMYHSSAVRESQKGASIKVANKYLNRFWEGGIPLEKDALLDTIDQAVGEFNALSITDQAHPKVGIVGEIYVKYNAFSNNYVADWLMEQGIEVVQPTFLEFFAGGLVLMENRVRTHLNRPSLLWILSILGKKLLRSFLNEVDGIMQRYRYYRPYHDIQEIARKAQEILSLNHQYGEGWLIAGEIVSFVKDGVNNVLCLQPFGCIANHVVAKGVEKRMKELYPQLNLLFLDADAGLSEVNFFNRMHFFINHAKQGKGMAV
jgi:predicted nucleotide-binding protein (sugar kinase/HSP70/actin superfamily)